MLQSPIADIALYQLQVLVYSVTTERLMSVTFCVSCLSAILFTCDLTECHPTMSSIARVEELLVKSCHVLLF